MFDATALSAVTDELNEEILHGRVQEIVQDVDGLRPMPGAGRQVRSSRIGSIANSRVTAFVGHDIVAEDLGQ